MAFGHILRRGVKAVSDRENYIARLKWDAYAYQNSDNPIQPQELMPVFLTILATLLLLWSIHYTVGNVVASLAMIESPSSTAIIETQPPPYKDEASEKDLLVEPEAAVAITVVDNKLVTSKIRTAIRHLHQTGGFTARWRGLGLAIFYHSLHSTVVGAFCHTFDLELPGEMLASIFVTVTLCRVHMAWTHKMISEPTKQWWFRRIPARKDCRVLLSPALFYAFAQEATFVLPYAVAQLVGIVEPESYFHRIQTEPHNCAEGVIALLRVLAVAMAFIGAVLLILFPATVTLTRIEAALLPENIKTIVPFDRSEVLNAEDLETSSGRHAVMVQAWRSFDGPSRWRIIKLYAKMKLIQIAVMFVSLHIVIAELYALGPERLVTMVKSGVAMVKLQIAQQEAY